MGKDWKGNATSIYATLGATNHSEGNREDLDFYATEPKAIKLLLELEEFDTNIWECACGEGHLSKELIDRGYKVKSTDIIDRGYGVGGIDFLQCDEGFNGDILTNPPYKYAKEFIEKAMDLIPVGNKVIMFLKVQFLEGKERKKLFKAYPPKKIYVSSSRLNCAKNGDFKSSTSSAVAYAWFIWEKGFNGNTIVTWFN